MRSFAQVSKCVGADVGRESREAVSIYVLCISIVVHVNFNRKHIHTTDAKPRKRKMKYKNMYSLLNSITISC